MLRRMLFKMDWIENPVYRRYAVFIIWTYDLIRFLLIFKLLKAYHVNPWIFFFLDMVTVPYYVLGWTRLIRSLSNEVQKLQTVLLWGIFTFFASTAPYLYTAWAGHQKFPALIWVILILVLIFPLANIAGKIFTALTRASSGPQAG